MAQYYCCIDGLKSIYSEGRRFQFCLHKLLARSLNSTCYPERKYDTKCICFIGIENVCASLPSSSLLNKLYVKRPLYDKCKPMSTPIALVTRHTFAICTLHTLKKFNMIHRKHMQWIRHTRSKRSSESQSMQ